jgi:hypothetical protein
MGLAAIVADIHTQLCAIDASFAAKQPDPLLGGPYLSENDAAPRVVWVALRAAPGPFAPTGREPRAFGMARHLAVACHIWGADTASAELLLQEVHNAARRSLGAGARWSSEDWPQQDGDAIAQSGTEVVVVFEFRLPITELGQAVATPTTAQQTVEIDFPNSTVSGSPAP